jgi:hypothetical protein
MADVRVRLPLGALAIGVWESLAIPPAPEAGDRWFKSNCADSIAELLEMKLRPRGAARSARLPVTQEIVGSNPIGDASIARYANGKAAKLKPS